MALGTKPEQLGLSLPSSKTVVYGIVMDWDVRNGTASIIAFMTGDASIYFSSGGGIIGGGAHEDVKIIAMGFVDEAQQMLSKTKKVEQTPLPDKDRVVFYLLTNEGIFSAQDELENLRNQTSIWLGLFLTANEVINEHRATNEK